jgi:hypothetical protein
MKSMSIGGDFKGEAFLTAAMQGGSSKKALHVLEKVLKDSEPLERENHKHFSTIRQFSLQTLPKSTFNGQRSQMNNYTNLGGQRSNNAIFSSP